MELKNQLLSKEEVFKDIVGQKEAKEQMKSALLSDRHVIIVGPPGVGKTTFAKNIAKILPELEVVDGCEFHCTPNNPLCPQCKTKKSFSKKKIKGIQRFIRIQGSPDLSVEDLLGDIDPIKAMKYGPLSMEAFTPGKIFKANNGVLFFDELNRCPEKLQNALLQVLQEKKCTIGSYDLDFEANLLFIGTMNPEDSSTERISDVLLDRFDIVYMNYPENIELEKEIVTNVGKKLCTVDESMLHFMIYFVRLLRQSEDLDKKPSVRASIGLYERSQSNALLKGKKKIDYEDIKDVVVSVLSHRIRLKPSIKYLMTPEDFVTKEFDKFSQSNVGTEIKQKKSDFR